jgi:katanin p60 ATPase-containing subunit A1
MGSYVEQIREKRLLADKAEVSGAFSEAAVLYQELAVLYYKWSIGTPYAIEKERKAEAKQLELRARTLAAKTDSNATGTGGQRLDDSNQRPHKSDVALRKDEQELYPIIESFLMTTSITWDDIGGLDQEVETILTALCLSFGRHPTGINLKRSKNLLLYGPPGTGKTLIASATCSSLYEDASDAGKSGLESQRMPSFFSVDIAALISKWVGESSKTIRLLFEVAKKLAPSVVFLDEFESLSQRRTGEDSAHESRVKGQILTQLDGFSSKDNSDSVLVIASTNRPWDIDSAVLSRFGSKIYIPLPNQEGRKRILSILSTSSGIPLDCNLAWLSSDQVTKNFSGRDLSNLFTAAIEQMVSTQNMNPGPSTIAKRGMSAMRNHQLKFRGLVQDDFVAALHVIKPQMNTDDLKHYERWGEDPSYRP